MADKFSDDLLLELRRLKQLESERAQNPAAADSLNAELSNLNFYEIAAGVGSDRNVENMSPTERALHFGDYQTLSAMHGPAVADRLKTQFLQAHSQMRAHRDGFLTPVEQARDLAVGVPGAAVSGVYGIAGLGAGLVSPEAGTFLAQTGEDWNKMIQSYQSDALAGRRQVDAARGAVIQRDNAADAAAMEAEGIPGFVAGGIRIGSDLGEGAVDSLQDPELFLQKSGESLGSMYAGGLVTKPLAALGKAAAASRLGAVAARTTPAVAAKLATKLGLNVETGAAALGLGSVEMGGTYQDTVLNVLNKSTDELYEISEPFREKVAELRQFLPQAEAELQAKQWLANRAGKLAAAGSAVAAIPLGLLGAGGAQPTKVLRSYLKDVFGEAVEEAGQETTNALAQNLAGRFAVGDENQDLLEGLGYAAGQAAVAGGFTAGTTKAPAGALEAIGLGAKGAAQAGKAISTKVADISAKKQAEAAKTSFLSGDSVQQRADALLASAIDPESSSLVQPLSLAERPEMEAVLPEELKSELSGTTTRVGATRKAAELLNKAADGSEEQEILAFYLQEVTSDFRYNNGITGKKNATKLAREYNAVVASVLKIPEVKKALEIAQKVVESPANETIITDQNLDTPEVLKEIDRELARAENAALAVPESVAPVETRVQNIQTILKHAATGKITLTHAQRTKLKGSLALLKAEEELLKQKVGAKVIDLINDRHFRFSSLNQQDAVRIDVTSADHGEGVLPLSARDYVDEVVHAMDNDDVGAAQNHLASFSEFVEHMQNKLGAINQHFAGRDPFAKFVPYMQLYFNPKTGSKTWAMSDTNPNFLSGKYKHGGEFVNFTKAESIAHAQEVAAEAKFVYDVLAALQQEFPDLQVELPVLETLNPALQGDPKELVQKFKDEWKKKKQEAAQATDTSEPAADPASTPAASSEAQSKAAASSPAEPRPMTAEEASELPAAALQKRLDAFSKLEATGKATASHLTTLSVLRAEAARRADPVVKFNEEIQAIPLKKGQTPLERALEHVESKIQNQPIEHGVVISPDGTVLWVSTGDDRNIPFSPERAKLTQDHGNAIFTHNHPSNGTFSPADLVVMQRENVAEIRAIAADGTTWRVVRPEGGWTHKPPPVDRGVVLEGKDAAAMDKWWRNTEAPFKFATLERGQRKGPIWERSVARMDQVVIAAGGNPADGSNAKGYTRELFLQIVAEETARYHNEEAARRGEAWQIEQRRPGRQFGKPGEHSGVSAPEAAAKDSWVEDQWEGEPPTAEELALLGSTTDSPQRNLMPPPEMEEQPDAETEIEAEIAPQQEASVEAPVAEAHTEYSKKLSTKEAFPDLIEGNRTVDTFQIDKKSGDAPPTRTFLLKNPLRTVQQAFRNSETLRKFMGTPKGRLEQDIADVYQLFLGSHDKDKRNVGGILEVMQKNLSKALNVKGKDGKTLLDFLRAGGPANEYIRGKVLNLLNEEGSSLNSEMMELTAMASIHWMLTHAQQERPLHEEELDDLVGRETASELTEKQLREISEGKSLTEAVRSLQQVITRFWGLRENRDADIAFVDGIPEAAAKEALRAMIEVGLIEVKTIDLRKILDRPDAKEIDRYVMVKPEETDILHKQLDIIKAYPDAIEEAIVTEPEQTSFYDEDVIPVKKTVLGVSQVDLGEKQLKTVGERQAEKYTPNWPFINLLRSFGKRGIETLWGTEIREGAAFNKEHKASIDGQNLQLVGAYDQLEADLAQMENRGAKAKKYQYAVTSTDRFMMVGRYNPQASKIMRHAMMSTWATVDVSSPDSPHYWGFMLATAQAFGIKVHKKDNVVKMEAIREAAEKLNGPLRPAIELLKKHISGDVKSEDVSALPSELRRIMKEAKVDGTEVSVLALLEHARLELDPDIASNFETGLYLEADGMTNGPFNTLGLLSSGPFTAPWVKAVGKGGLNFGSTPRTSDTLDAQEKADLYETSTNHTKDARADLYQTLKAQKTGKWLLEVNDNLNGLMGDLFPGGLKITENEEGHLVLHINRGVAKNPLTITVYGSGPKGIANNLVSILVDEYYAMLSAAAQAVQQGKEPWEGAFPGVEDAEVRWTRVNAGLRYLVANEVGHSKLEGTYWVKKTQKGLNNQFNSLKDFEDFKFDKQTTSILMNNMLYLLVNPMVTGIERTLGSSVFHTRDLMLKTTQLQSIMFREIYFNALKDKIEQKKIELNVDPKRSVFLSRKEMNEVWENVRQWAPYATVDGQPFLVMKQSALEREAKGKVGKDYAFKFSRALDESMETPANIPGPANAGKLAVPQMVQGLGDGRMMREIYQEPAPRTLDVYDGLNMPIDMIKSIGERANKGAWHAWSTGNIALGLEEMFTRFLADEDLLRKMLTEWKDDFLKAAYAQTLTIEELNKTPLGQVLRVLNLAPTMLESKDPIGLIMAEIGKVKQDLTTKADEIASRQQVYADVAISMDQMSAASAPFVKKGIEIPETATPEEVAAILETLRLERVDAAKAENDEKRAEWASEKEGLVKKGKEKEAAKQLEGEIPSGTKLVKSLPSMARIFTMGEEHSSGVRILNRKAMKKLLSVLDLSDAERSLLGDLLQSKAVRDYQIVAGRPQDIHAYQQSQGLDSMPSSEGQTVYGFTAPGDPTPTIYLMTGETETVVHELIHAATFATVLAHYEGKDLGTNTQVTKDAIERLENLMDLFLQTNFEADSNTALVDAANAIVEKRDDTSLTPAQRKAVALNEFMAWTLANRKLAEELATVATPQNSLFQIAKKAYAAIKKLIWGNKQAPKPGKDMLSQIQFNTAIVMKAQPNLGNIARSNALKHAVLANQPGSDRLRNLRESFTQKIIDPVVQNSIVDPQKDADLPEHTGPRKVAAELLTEAQQHFTMGAEESATFGAIVNALATDQKIAPNALIEAHKLYDHFVRNLKESHLRPADTDEQNADYIASQRYRFLIGRTVKGTDAKGRSTLLPVFLALALTNEEFRSILSKMEVPKTVKVEGKGFDGMVENVGIAGIERLSDLLSGTKHPANVRDALDELGSSITKSIMDEQAELNRKFSISKGSDIANDYMVGKLEKLANLAQGKSDELKESNNRLKRATGKVLTSFAGLISSEHANTVAEEFVGLVNRLDGWVTFREIVRDLTGRTKNNAVILDMVKWVRSTVSQLRQEFREKVPVIIKKKFKNKLSIEQSTSLHRAMGRSDMAALLDRMDAQQVLKLVTDREAIVEAATRLENKLKKYDPKMAKMILQKVDQYVKFVNEGVADGTLLRNAYAITNLFGMLPREEWKSPEDVWAPPAEMIEDVDQLLTLRLLDTMPEKDFDTFAELVKNEPEGIEFTLNYLQGQRKTEKEKVKSGPALTNHYKGWLPTEINQRASLLVMDDSQEDELRLLGYERVGSYNGSGLEPGMSRGYYYSPEGGTRTQFQQGIAQNVQATGYGVHLNTGYSTGMTGGVITDPKKVGRLYRRIRNGLEDESSENLMPIWDASGNIVAYERAIHPEMAALVRQEQQDLPKMIGHWRGRQLEEEMAKVVNQELVGNLKKVYDTGLSEGKAEEFINVFESKDPVIRDAVKLFTPEFIEMIADKFGTDEDGVPYMYVRKDMVNDVIGARQASIGDSWTGNSRFSEETQKVIKDSMITVLGIDAYRKLVWAERNWQSVVASVKTNIVVRSMVVPAANTLSGIYQLIARGVPLKAIAKGLGGKLVEIEFYTKTLMEKVELEAELRAKEGKPFDSHKIQTRLKAIEDAHRRLSIWPLIEAGEFSTIADVGLTADDLGLTSGNVMEVMAKKVDELPPGLRGLARQGYLARDTSLFRALQKSVQYSDFLMKAIYHDHLLKKEDSRDVLELETELRKEGVPATLARKQAREKNALAKITEEFNNYDLSTGRARGYMESMGAFWFLNYPLRATKIALRMVRENPFHLLLMTAIPHPTFGLSPGGPVSDNILSKLINWTIGYSVTPRMMVEPIGINTWLNMAVD